MLLLLGNKSEKKWTLEKQQPEVLYKKRYSIKKVFLEISQNSQKNTCARISFLKKLQACNYIKNETLAHVFSCEFCEISKNTFFTEHLWTTASDFSKKINETMSFNSCQGLIVWGHIHSKKKRFMVSLAYDENNHCSQEFNTN